MKKSTQAGKTSAVRKSAKAKPEPSLPPHHPETSLERLGWIRRPQLTALGKLGITKLRDLLEHYPRRHEDR